MKLLKNIPFIPLVPGVLELKHREAMGLALFTYFCLVALCRYDPKSRKTGTFETTIAQLAEEEGVTPRTIKRDLATLRHFGYITTNALPRSLQVTFTKWHDIEERYDSWKASQKRRMSPLAQSGAVPNLSPLRTKPVTPHLIIEKDLEKDKKESFEISEEQRKRNITRLAEMKASLGSMPGPEPYKEEDGR